MRDRTICRRDAGSTLERRHEAPLKDTRSHSFQDGRARHPGSLSLPANELPRKRERLHETETFDGFNHAFLDAETALFDPAEWTVLDAKAGYFINIHAAAAELFDGRDRLVQVSRDDTGTQSVGSGIGDRDGVVEIADHQDRRQRSKTLARHHATVARHVGDDRGLQLRSAPPAADENPRAGCDRLIHDRFEVYRSLLVDHRADARRLIHRVAAEVLLCLADQTAGEFGNDAVLHEDAFD